MKRLKEAMLLLVANDAPLGPQWLEHALSGEWSDHRECHMPTCSSDGQCAELEFTCLGRIQQPARQPGRDDARD
jgi:hypothetical protein